jgi:ABC-type nitrate/sulfonate/bicarbonate transport system ATPase subunit
MAAGPRVSVDIAEKRYSPAAAPVLRNIKFEIAPGEVVALVGPSGIGKSTLLRMIAGVDAKFEGSIRIGDQSAAEAPPPGLVFQDSRLLPWLTSIRNITAVRPAVTREDAHHWLERVGLDGYDDALPGELSGGMQRRVALARALAVNPGFLLLDEPFVSLDRRLVTEIQTLFAGLIAAETSTVILVTHLPEDAAVLADRAIVLGHRPAQILADLSFDSRRGERDAMEVARLAALLTSAAPESV